MSVDLADLIPSLKYTVNPPGQDLFEATTSNEWVVRLENAFWTARLDGLFKDYKSEDGEIVPLSGADDLSREHQQLIVLYAGLDVVLSELRNVQSSFRAKAGPVEFETARSANLLRDVLNAIRSRIREIVAYLSSYSGMGTMVYDAVIYRTEALAYGDIWDVR